MLLAGTDEYKAAKGTEAVYEGVIDNNPADGTVGKPTRFNAYRFTGKDADGKEFVRELYVPDKAFLLAAFVGKRVRVTGKFADVAADGKVHSELWPAQVEEIAVAVAPPLPRRRPCPLRLAAGGGAEDRQARAGLPQRPGVGPGAAAERRRCGRRPRPS